MIRLRTPEQVAAGLGVTPKTVTEMARRGELAGTKVGRQWRFSDDDVDAYLDARRHHASSAPAPFIPDSFTGLSTLPEPKHRRFS